MKKFICLFVLSLIAVAFSSCHNDDETLDTRLIVGKWQLITQDSPEGDYIYNFTTRVENTWSWGTLVTYSLAASGMAIRERAYEWHVTDPNNSNPVILDIIYQGDLDKEDSWEKTEYYEVTKLSASEMLLKRADMAEPKTILRFVRRNNIALP